MSIPQCIHQVLIVRSIKKVTQHWFGMTFFFFSTVCCDSCLMLLTYLRWDDSLSSSSKTKSTYRTHTYSYPYTWTRMYIHHTPTHRYTWPHGTRLHRHPQKDRTLKEHSPMYIQAPSSKGKEPPQQPHSHSQRPPPMALYATQTPTGSTTIRKIILSLLDNADDNWWAIWILLSSSSLSSNCLSESGFMEVAASGRPRQSSPNQKCHMCSIQSPQTHPF